jgi:hypothetical protein
LTSEAMCQWLAPVILAIWEAEIWRIIVQGQPRQIVHETPISKITRAKWTGGVTQAVQHLPCKHEVLSSNPSTDLSPPKKRKKLQVILLYALIQSKGQSSIAGNKTSQCYAL